MQDDSNLRQLPAPKLSAKKKYFASNFIHLTQNHVRFYPLLPISVIVFSFRVSALIFLTLTPNIPNLFIAIPQHIIISPIHAVDIQHFLKTFSITFGEMHCHAVMIHTG